MDVATSRVEVGVRDLKNNLSRYLDEVGNGTEVTVTDRGRPVARLVRVDASLDHLSELIASGAVQPAQTRSRRLPTRITASGSVSDLVADQRR
jgi:prevent-host-death family protein